MWKMAINRNLVGINSSTSSKPERRYVGNSYWIKKTLVPTKEGHVFPIFQLIETETRQIYLAAVRPDQICGFGLTIETLKKNMFSI